MAAAPALESAAGGSLVEHVPFNIACALRIELSVVVCALPSHIGSICLQRDSRRVRLLAVTNARATFYVLIPAPFNDSTAPFPLTFSLRGAGGKEIYKQELYLSQLLVADGWSLLSNFLDNLDDAAGGKEGTKEGAKERKEVLRIQAAAVVITDPVKELPKVPSKILRLAENRSSTDEEATKAEVCFDECVRERFAAPAVPVQCGVPKSQAVPFISIIQSPRKLAFWAIRRPAEGDDDEDQLIDIGDGVLAPKRNIAKLRRAAKREEGTPRLPAEKGRASLLQSCSLKPVGVYPPLSIPLGKPISLEHSTVLDASTILDQDMQFIDDVSISDSESENLEEEDEEEEDEEESINFETPKSKNDSDDGAPSEASGATEQSETDSPGLTKLPSAVTAVSNMEKFMAVPDAPLVRKFSSKGGDPHGDITGDITESPSHAPLLMRVEKAERDKTYLQRQLVSAQEERERLLEQLKSANLITKCAAQEAELVPLRTELDKLRKEHAEVQDRMEVLTAAHKGSVPKEKVDNLIELGQKYKSQLRDTKQENDRLLNVIGQLSKEMERQPGAHEILAELAAAKTDLVVEKAENERLSRELTVLKSSVSPRSVVEGPSGFSPKG